MTDFSTLDNRMVWLMGLLLKDFPQWGVDDAAADAGNAAGESLIQMVQEAGHTPPAGGWGLYQWTGARRTEFMNYCARAKRDPNAMESGYAFHFVELKGTFLRVVSEVAAAGTISDKVLAFEQHYEMAGIPRIGSRLVFANRAKAAWMAQAPVQAPMPTPAPPVATPAPTPVKPPAVATGKPGNQTMANPLDAIRDMIDKVRAEVDSVAKLPWIGTMVAPVANIIDQIASIIDQIDPKVPVASQAAPPPATPPK